VVQDDAAHAAAGELERGFGAGDGGAGNDDDVLGLP
jgi:hypothetical protein